MWILGFGTLLYQSSLKDTIGEEKNNIEYIPVVIKDYKRLFNVYAEHYEPSHKISDKNIEMGAANIKFAKGNKLNAVAFEATDHDVALLDKRERYYERIQVEAYHFDTGEMLSNAFVYCAKDSFSCIRNSIDELLPLWRDVDYARRGSYALGEAFGKLYDETTYLADSKTLMFDFYKTRVDEYDTMI